MIKKIKVSDAEYEIESINEDFENKLITDEVYKARMLVLNTRLQIETIRRIEKLERKLTVPDRGSSMR